MPLTARLKQRPFRPAYLRTESSALFPIEGVRSRGRSTNRNARNSEVPRKVMYFRDKISPRESIAPVVTCTSSNFSFLLETLVKIEKGNLALGGTFGRRSSV